MFFTKIRIQSLLPETWRYVHAFAALSILVVLYSLWTYNNAPAGTVPVLVREKPRRIHFPGNGESSSGKYVFPNINRQGYSSSEMSINVSRHANSSFPTLTDKKEFSIESQYTSIQNGSPVRHIALMKIHKAASSTMANILLRYGYANDLVFALPRCYGSGGPSLTPEYFFPPHDNKKYYDITCGHVPYNRSEFSKVLHNDTIYIGTVREPFSQFQSFVRFYHPRNILNTPGPNPVLAYLSGDRKHVTSRGYFPIPGNVSHEFNMMANEFGFPQELFFNADEYKTKQYLRKLDKEMDLVLVVEYFDESLILMRRILNWDLRYILYVGINSNKRQPDPRLQFGSNEKSLYRHKSYLDYFLYDFFLKKMKKIIYKQPSDFYHELAYFKRTRAKYNHFCSLVLSRKLKNAQASFKGSKWNRPFVLKRRDCLDVFVTGAMFLQKLIKEQGLYAYKTCTKK